MINNKNTIVYTGPSFDLNNETHYTFDVFVNEKKLTEILNWLTKENINFFFDHPEDFLVYFATDTLEKCCEEPIRTENVFKNKKELDKDLFKDRDTVWLWLFVKDEASAIHFRLLWEEHALTNKN